MYVVGVLLAWQLFPTDHSWYAYPSAQTYFYLNIFRTETTWGDVEYIPIGW